MNLDRCLLVNPFSLSGVWWTTIKNGMGKNSLHHLHSYPVGSPVIIIWMDRGEA